MFGIQFPSDDLETALQREYQLFRRRMQQYNIQNVKDLVDLPFVETPQQKCIARAFQTVMPCLYLTDPLLMRVCSVVCINWSILNGTSPDFGYLYPIFAMVLLWYFGDYEGAHALAMVFSFSPFFNVFVIFVSFFDSNIVS